MDAPAGQALAHEVRDQNESTDNREGGDEALLDEDVFDHVQHGSHTFVLEREDAAAGAGAFGASGFWMAGFHTGGSS